MKKIAYILSMQVGGLLHFNYREIEKLYDDNYDIHIFPTKYKKGEYMPDKDWYFHNISIFYHISYIFRTFISDIGLFIHLFVESLKNRSVIEFFLNIVKESLRR